MRSSAGRRYAMRVIIYTVVYVLIVAIVVVNENVNSFISSILYNYLPIEVYNAISIYRTIVLVLLYIMGLVFISMAYVFKLSRLLRTASRSISEDEPKIFGDSCPDELRVFSQKLKEFKFEIKKNEQARQLAEQQKNDLIVYLAHDLKTPLTSVIGYLSLLEEAGELPAEQRAKYVGIALDKAYRLEQLINEFFDITRLNLQTVPTQKTNVNLTILLIQILDEFFPMFEEKHLNIVQNIESEVVVFADADKLARVFDNLFRNAVNYSYVGSDIECEAYKKGKYAIIKVRNRGDNIPQGKLDRMFEKFYRLDSARQSSTGGSGLGLAIAKQIVELHDGRIAATSNDGIIEITVVLPI